jgi:hypothetical protein
MDLVMNGLLNIFEFLGIEHANQIIIFIMILAFGLMYKLSEMSKWIVGIFLVIMGISLATALYQIVYDARAQCIYAYDDSKPVFADSLTRKLEWEDIRKLNCPTLWVARNEIYHRSKYCFFTPRGFAYFESGQKTCDFNVSNASTPIGNANVKLISSLERRKGCRSPPSSCRAFSRVPSSRLILSRAPLKAQ